VSDLVSATSGDLSVGHATLTYTALSEGGEKLRSLDNRITVALRRTGDSGRWKIFHEHTSGPIEHPSLKGIVQRSGTV
jgi:ketosteroid isomerase-like protein